MVFNVELSTIKITVILFVCSSNPLRKHCFYFLRDHGKSQEKLETICLCKILEGPKKSIMVFLIVANKGCLLSDILQKLTY